MSHTISGMIGRPTRRREDLRFITGRGRYVADLALDHAAHVAVVRSQHAHARILRVDASAARALSGVLGVFTLVDLPELRGALPPPVVPGVAVKAYRQSALADDVVRFVGEPVAAVVATDAYAAADGAAAIGVEYEPLPPAVDPEAAIAPGAPLVHAAWETSVAQVDRDLRVMERLVADPKTDLFARIPHGTGQTLLREALVLADHNSYHLGQLVLLRRLLGAWKKD